MTEDAWTSRIVVIALGLGFISVSIGVALGHNGALLGYLSAISAILGGIVGIKIGERRKQNGSTNDTATAGDT